MASTLLTNDTAAAARCDVRAGKYLTSQLANEEFGIRVLTVRELMGVQEITAFRRRPIMSKASSI